MSWKHIDTGIRSAAANMELDSALLADLKDESEGILHLYDWERDAVTYGYFIDPDNFLNKEGVSAYDLDLAKRPTGGGIIFHNCDLAFSVLLPATHPQFSTNPLDNYAFVNNRVIWAISQVIDLTAELLPVEPTPLNEHCKSFCMAKLTKYDVMVDGKKMGGAAQRKTRDGFLHQGSISLGALSEEFLRGVLAAETQVVEGMRSNTFALLGEKWTQKELQEARLQIRQALTKAFND